MADSQYIRAEYDDELNAYVSVDANWIDHKPSLIYRFERQESDTQSGVFDGVLAKRWLNEAGEADAEYFIFGVYQSEEAFNADVVQVVADARDVAEQDNLDELLAVIDILKKRTIDSETNDPALLASDELEGLFENGPEDAYTLHDLEDGPRLHHHVERDDECWYLHVAPVVDEEQQALGWGLFAVYFPGLASDVSAEVLKHADSVRILLLDHHDSKADALLAKRSFTMYMETDRLDNPEYAYSNDTEVLGDLATNADWNTKEETYAWTELSGEQFQRFLTAEVSFVYPTTKWQPPEQNLVDRFFETHPQPTWIEDQFRSFLDAEAGITPDLDEDSPWQDLDLG